MKKKGLGLAPIHPLQGKEPDNSLGPAAIGDMELMM